jgi:lipid II:glycine glycyltransferase (peptidoglycan interpeptide bridge formation enzyme)
MIAITRSKYGLPVSDIFFADSVQESLPRTPLRVFQQTARQHRLLKPVQTSVIDLTVPIEDISSLVSKNTQYKIRRAEREGFTPRLVMDPAVDDVARYADYHDTFARHKGLPPCNRTKLKALCESSALLLSSVVDADGNLLAAHAYVKDSSSGRVRLLYSASHFRAMCDSGERNKVGRANRLLHWYEILTLKDLGFRLYDLGGIPLDSSDREKNDVARFNLEFGGKMLIEYSGVLPTNVVGKVLLPLARRRLG